MIRKRTKAGEWEVSGRAPSTTFDAPSHSMEIDQCLLLEKRLSNLGGPWTSWSLVLPAPCHLHLGSLFLITQATRLPLLPPNASQKAPTLVLSESVWRSPFFAKREDHFFITACKGSIPGKNEMPPWLLVTRVPETFSIH